MTDVTVAAADKLLAIPRRLYLRIKCKRRNYFITARQDLSN